MFGIRGKGGESARERPQKRLLLESCGYRYIGITDLKGSRDFIQGTSTGDCIQGIQQDDLMTPEYGYPPMPGLKF